MTWKRIAGIAAAVALGWLAGSALLTDAARAQTSQPGIYLDLDEIRANRQPRPRRPQPAARVLGRTAPASRS